MRYKREVKKGSQHSIKRFGCEGDKNDGERLENDIVSREAIVSYKDESDLGFLEDWGII